MSEPSRERRVFIVGVRRSGTTWTMSLLAQHPEVVAVQQVDFFRPLVHFGRWFASRHDFGTCLLAPELRAGLAGERTSEGLQRVPLASALSPELFPELARPLAEAVYARFAATSPRATTVVEQTPEYVQVWEQILAIFPDAYFLHVIRDPRSVFCSHRDAAKGWADPLRFSYDPAHVAAEWKREVEQGRRIRSKTERVLEIRYEDLKQDAVLHLSRIFEWIGLPADEALCRRAVEACSFEKVKASSKLAPKGFFRSGKSEGWRDEMSARELRVVEHLCGELMRELGYELVHAYPVAKPFGMAVRDRISAARRAFARWAWHSDGPLRRFASSTVKAVPPLRRFLLKKVKRPV